MAVRRRIFRTFRNRFRAVRVGGRGRNKRSGPNREKESGGIFRRFWYPRRESNPDLRFRKPPFYPLNYKGSHVFFAVRRLHCRPLSRSDVSFSLRSILPFCRPTSMQIRSCRPCSGGGPSLSPMPSARSRVERPWGRRPVAIRFRGSVSFGLFGCPGSPLSFQSPAGPCLSAPKRSGALSERKAHRKDNVFFVFRN